MSTLESGTPVPARRQVPGLRTRDLVGLLATAHSPLTALWLVIPAAIVSGQVIASPLIFLIAGLIMLVFVLGYGGLARRMRHSGGLYVQVMQGLGRPLGVGAAAVTILGYLLVLAGLYSATAALLKALVLDVTKIDLPLALVVILSVLTVLAASRLSIRTTARIASFIAVEQIAVILWLDTAAIRKPAGGHVSFTSLDPAWILTGSFAAALVYSITAFVGSEAAGAYSGELRDPRRSIPTATYLGYALTTAVLVISGWAVSVAVGPQDLPLRVVSQGGAFVPGLIYQLTGGSKAVSDLLLGNLVLAIIASGLMFNHASARLLSGLARDRLLPAAFAVRRRGLPPRAMTIAIQPLAAGAIALIAVWATPDGVVPGWMVIGGSLGISGVLTLVSASAAVWFLRGEADEGGFFGWEGQVIAGLLSTLSLGLIFLYGVTHVRSVIPSAPARAGWLVGTAIATVFAMGVVWALTLKAKRRDLYDAIGANAFIEAERESFPLPHVPAPRRAEEHHRDPYSPPAATHHGR